MWPEFIFDPVMSVWNSELLVLDHSSRFKISMYCKEQHFFQSKQCWLHFATIPNNQKNNAKNRISWKSSSASALVAWKAHPLRTERSSRCIAIFQFGLKGLTPRHRQMDAARSLGIDRCETAVICCPLLGKSWKLQKRLFEKLQLTVVANFKRLNLNDLMSYGGDDSSDGENEEEEGPGRPFSSFGSWLSSCRLPGQRTHWKFQEKCPWGCRGKAPTGPHLSGEDLCLTLFKRIHRVNLFGVLVLTCSESEPGLNELMFQRSEQ